MGYGAQHAAVPLVFVVTHTPPSSPYALVPASASSSRASAARGGGKRGRAAGEKDVVIMGGGDVIGQSLVVGLADELRLHLAPLVLGGGTPLFKADGRTGCDSRRSGSRRTRRTSATRSQR